MVMNRSDGEPIADGCAANLAERRAGLQAPPAQRRRARKRPSPLRARESRYSMLDRVLGQLVNRLL